MEGSVFAAAAVELTAPSAASDSGEGGRPSADEGVVSSEVSSAVFTSFSAAAASPLVVAAAASPRAGEDHFSIDLD